MPLKSAEQKIRVCKEMSLSLVLCTSKDSTKQKRKQNPGKSITSLSEYIFGTTSTFMTVHAFFLAGVGGITFIKLIRQCFIRGAALRIVSRGQVAIALP